jgi:hypothetical protein
MAKDHTDKEVEKLKKELDEEHERAYQAMIALVEAKNQLQWTQTELLKHLTGTNAGAPVSETPKPPNYNSPDFDKELNEQIDNLTVTHGIVSQVYHGRFVTIQMTGSGGIDIGQQSHHQVQADENYKPTRLKLSPETFFLILEAMEFAEKKFGLDRKAAIEKLTGGGELNFKDAICLI